MTFYDDITGSKDWIKVELVNKGWSEDRKYHIYTKEGSELLLRVTGISQYDAKKEEFEKMVMISNSKILMSQPIKFGVCNNREYVYSLLTWIRGEDAEITIEKMNSSEQYSYGLIAGKYLQGIHKFPAPVQEENWFDKFNRKIDRNIKNYKSCGFNLKYADELIEYINNNRYLLRNRPQCLQHGDYHTGNMVVTSTGKLGIIDFNRWDYGDPWEEFNRIVWCVKTSKSFASGYINGYFNNQVPDLFFKLMVLYVTANELASIPWAINYGQTEIDVMINLAQDVADWYNGFTIHIPKWYEAKSN